MLVNVDKLKYYLDMCKERKDEIRTVYNRVLELTDPFYEIKDSGKTKIGTQRNIDSEVVDAIDALVSFIMSSIMPRQGSWAEVDLDKDKMLEYNNGELPAEYDEAIKLLADDNAKVSRYIQSSNYYTEISKAVQSFVKVGTGCYCVRETNSTSKPFIYSYVGLDNLYINNDSFGSPNIIFKVHPELNAEEIYDIFGKDCIIPEVSEDDLSGTIDVIECVIPSYDENTTNTIYNYMIMTENFDHLIKEEQLEYNPYKVFRFELIEGSPWGKSVVSQRIDSLEDLESWKEIFKTQAKSIADPATIFYGNMELFYALSLENGDRNYGGDPNQGQQQARLDVVGNGSQLMPIDKLITEARNSFRRALMVENIGATIDQGKNTTAAYVSMLQENFRRRFSNTYELINSELLEPTYLAPFIIMLKYKMLNLTTDIIPYTTLKYVNSISKANNMNEVNNIISYTQVIATINQANAMGVYLDLPKAVSKIGDLMNMDKDIIPTEAQLEEIQEAIRQQQMIQQQNQMMAAESEQQAL